MENVPNFNNIKTKAENFYKKIGKLFCYALNEDVYFNAEGLNHLMFKNTGARTQKEQAVKLKFLAIAKEIIETTTTYQEYEELLLEISVRKYGKKSKKMTLVKYWGFVAIIKNYRVKAIVRQVGNGKKHFWSVMPTWKLNHYRGTDLVSNSRGNLAED